MYAKLLQHIQSRASLSMSALTRLSSSLDCADADTLFLGARVPYMAICLQAGCHARNPEAAMAPIVPHLGTLQPVSQMSLKTQVHRMSSTRPRLDTWWCSGASQGASMRGPSCCHCVVVLGSVGLERMRDINLDMACHA